MTPGEQKAHEDHAMTLALLAFGAIGVVIFFADRWLASPHRGAWADLGRVILYVVAFFGVFGLSALKGWFLERLIKGK